MRLLDCPAPSIVADFACGEGALLVAAAERWPDVEIVAVDVDPNAITAVKTRIDSVTSIELDFLSSGDPKLDQLQSKYSQKISLVLLNPPFSCRGASRLPVVWRDCTFTASKALAFVIRSLDFLSDDGNLVALLPASCLSSQKDKSALAILKRYYHVRVLSKLSPYVFRGCTVAVDVVVFSKNSNLHDQSRNQIADRVGFSDCRRPILDVEILRGSFPNPAKAKDQSGDLPLIHTTSLHNFQVVSSRKVTTSRSKIFGPALLLPRVGRFRADKLCLYYGNRMSVISDCIIALTCDDISVLSEVRDRIINHIDVFCRLYSGTCAPYITVDKVQSFLAVVGVNAVISRAKRAKEGEVSLDQAA